MLLNLTEKQQKTLWAFTQTVWVVSEFQGLSSSNFPHGRKLNRGGSLRITCWNETLHVSDGSGSPSCNYFYLMDPLIHYLFILSPSLHHHYNAHNNESYHINPLCPSCHSLLARSLSPACDVSSFLPTSHLSHCSSFFPLHILSSFSISRTTILPVILLFFIALSLHPLYLGLCLSSDGALCVSCNPLSPLV